MKSFISIRETDSSYDIYPIEEKDEDSEDFIPYARQKITSGSQVCQSLDFKKIRNSLSQSLQCKGREAQKARRCKTLQKEEKKTVSQFSSLAVNTTNVLLPFVIHSIQQAQALQRLTQEKQSSKKSRLERLQGEMKKHRPVFFQDRAQELSKTGEKPVRVMHVQAARSNVFLFQLKGRPQEQLRSGQISGKQLKKFIRVHKMQTSWQSPPPAKLQLNRQNGLS